MTVKNFIATKALIRHNGKILILRESGAYRDGVNVGRYDVPGGRIEPGENLLTALHREIAEECGLTVTAKTRPFFSNDVVVPKSDEEWHITRHYYACAALHDAVTLSSDHDQFQWIDPAAYATSNLIANLHEVFAAYLTLNRRIPRAGGGLA